jgi:membrane protease YdiL (CAAX protease family)
MPLLLVIAAALLVPAGSVWADTPDAVAAPVGPPASEGDDSGASAIDPSPAGEWGPIDTVFLAGLAVWLAVAGAVVARRRLWRLPEPMTRPETRSAAALVLLGGGALVWLASQVGAASAAALVLAFDDTAPDAPDAEPSLWLDALALSGMYVGAGLALTLVVAAQPAVVRFAGLTLRARDLALGVGGLALALPAVFVVSYAATAAAQWLSGEPTDPLTHETLRQLVAADRLLPALVVAVLVCTLTPLLEEVIYRGLLQTGVRELGGSPWVAVASTSLLFAWMHVGAVAGSEHALVGLLALSICLGVIRERTGSVAPAVIAHGLFNALNVGLAFAGG